MYRSRCLRLLKRAAIHCPPLQRFLFRRFLMNMTPEQLEIMTRQIQALHAHEVRQEPRISSGDTGPLRPVF